MKWMVHSDTFNTVCNDWNIEAGETQFIINENVK